MKGRRKKAIKKKEKYQQYFQRDLFTGRENYSTSGLTTYFIEKIHGKRELYADDIWREWEGVLKNKRDNLNLNFYTHVPYCTERCAYCCSFSNKLQREEELEEYVNSLVKYYRYFQGLFEGVVFDNLYIGGGSPNILSEDLLEKMLSAIFECFAFTRRGERTMENAPRNSSFRKLEIARKKGINRVSFGVQTFNKEVLEKSNRLGQTEEEVKKAVGDAKRLDFKHINIDLLMGLYGESVESFVESFKKATELEPTTISIYSLQPTGGYLSTVYHKTREEFFEHRRKMIEESMKKILEITQKGEYFVGGLDEVGKEEEMRKHFNTEDCFQVKRRDRVPEKKEDALAGFSNGELLETAYVSIPIEGRNAIFGLGKGAGSFIPGKMQYSMEDPLKENPSEYKFSGIEYDLRKEMMRSIIATLSTREFVSLEKFKADFGKSLLKEFKKPIRELQEIGVVRVENGKMYLDCEDPQERFVYLLFFLDERDVVGCAKKERKKRKEKEEKDSKNEEMEISEELRRKIEKTKKEEGERCTERVEGTVVKKEKNKISVKTKEGSVKNIDLEKEVLFVESFLDPDNFYQARKKREISFEDILPSDEVVVFVHDSEKKESVIMVTKISVLGEG